MSMAVSSVCRSGLLSVVARGDSDRLQGPSSSPSAPGLLLTPQHRASQSLPTQRPAEPARWVTRAVLAATAAAALSLTSSTPVVHALEEGLFAYNSPGNIGINIAIPIPDPDQWVFSEYGFIAPLPGRGPEDMRAMAFDVGCPAWQVTEFEKVVPDHGHPRPYPRRGNQWPASLSAEEAVPLFVLAHGGQDGGQDLTLYPNLEEVLEEISSLGGLACFNL